jgi:hypothetical protein
LSIFEDLVDTCNDLLDNLVHSNLRAIKATCFLDLPSKQAFAVEDFLAAQTKAIKKHTDAVTVRYVCIVRLPSLKCESVSGGRSLR